VQERETERERERNVCRRTKGTGLPPFHFLTGVYGKLWRKLHNDELHSLYSLPNTVRMIKSRRMRWAGHVERMGEGRGVYRVLVGRPEGKRPLGSNDLREIKIDGANSIQLAQDSVQWRACVNTVMNLRVP
jgi:hypothetical protein